MCDTDLDGDGVVNDLDNCPYFSNADQTDVDGNGVGDTCEEDADGDLVLDKDDTCPHNPALANTTFSRHFVVMVDPTATGDEPRWEVKDDGAEVQQMVYTWKPSMLIGNQHCGNPFYNKHRYATINQYHVFTAQSASF